MDAMGYVKGLPGIIKEHDYNLVEYGLFPYDDPRNPTAVMVIEKKEKPSSIHKLACPQCKTELKLVDNAFYSPEAMRVYPIINGIPCLRIENGIIASKYMEFVK
jgi:uncharacterized protein YbaR (Trm112 family)